MSEQKQEYILKHKDFPVMLFSLDTNTHRLLEIGEIFDEKRLPFGLKDKGNMLRYGIQFDEWLQCRGLSGSRRDLPEIKKLFGNKDARELLIQSHGLNLTDHYWIKKKSEELLWEKINCFDNVFDKIIEGKKANPVIDKSVNEKSPNFCVDGSIEKRWVIIENQRYLLKGSRYPQMQEPFNEVIASEILNLYGLPCINYHLERTSAGIPFSKCKCMVDRDTEYITAQTVIDSEDLGQEDILSHYLKICNNNGIKDAKEKVDIMIAIDFIIGNDDRHRGNFGIIRNANNLKWLGIAKLLDHGNSLFFDRSDEDLKECGIDSLGKAFGDGNRLNLNVIDYPEWFHTVSSDKIIDIIDNSLKSNERLSSKRIEKIIDVTKERIAIFKKVIENKKRPKIVAGTSV